MGLDLFDQSLTYRAGKALGLIYGNYDGQNKFVLIDKVLSPPDKYRLKAANNLHTNN